MLRNTLKNIGWSLLSYWLGSPSLLGVFQYSQIVLLNYLYRLPNKATFQPKYYSYIGKLKPCKNRLQRLKAKSKSLIRLGWKMPVLLLISQFVSITATCQKDTLTTQELNKYYSLIGLINTDLKDYDLVKQKSALQDQQIKGLQAITHKQQAVSVRKEYKLDLYASQITQLQINNTNLQSQVSTTTKKLKWARLENWLWRGGALILIAKSFKLF